MEFLQLSDIARSKLWSGCAGRPGFPADVDNSLGYAGLR
jgi:hypothetical protein